MPLYPQLETNRGRSGWQPVGHRPRRGLARLSIFALTFALTVAVGLIVAPSVREASQPVTVHRASRRTVPSADQKLAAALAPILKRHRGSLAVGVIDNATDATAVYDGGQPFHTAGIVTADLLAALLLQRQGVGRGPNARERTLVTKMIENSNNDATTDLWQKVGGAEGVAAENAHLGLRQTTPGADGFWGLTSTTVTDQLTLLSDLTGAHSALNGAARSYELGLMRQVEADQNWGVTAAATPATASAVKDGWLPDPRLWVLNSIGVIHHGGQLLLVAVLSSDQLSEAGGIAQDEAAALAAVRAVALTRS